jgi:aminopeptidase N
MSYLQMNWDFAENPDTPIGLPVDGYSSNDYVSIIYGKGAFFYQALRERMGDEAWGAFMQDYVATYSWGIGYTADFKAMAEEHCGCDLSDLFAEWVYP